MVESILLVLWVGTACFFGFREYKEAKDRESHEGWLADVRECLDRIEHEFRWRCKEIAEEEFSQQKFSSYTYNAKIRELEKDYKNDMPKKVVEQMGNLGKYRITTVPDHLASEYKRCISDIADIYCEFGNLL